MAWRALSDAEEGRAQKQAARASEVGQPIRELGQRLVDVAQSMEALRDIGCSLQQERRDQSRTLNELAQRVGTLRRLFTAVSNALTRSATNWSTLDGAV